jgi:hypothetical protein
MYICTYCIVHTVRQKKSLTVLASKLTRLVFVILEILVMMRVLMSYIQLCYVILYRTILILEAEALIKEDRQIRD